MTALTPRQIEQCWIDPWEPTSNGYPQAQVHRRICQAVWGPPPTPKQQAAHSCGNKRCINPNHLRWATVSENALDKNGHGTMLIGEDHPMTKLTHQQVIEMREMAAHGRTQRDLAHRFGVSQSTVSNIVNEQTWRMA